MAFASSNLRMITDAGFGAQIGGGQAVWHYRSTDPSSTVTQTGYFSGCGEKSKGNNAVGMKVGDIVIVSESTGGATPGRTIISSVISATANQASTSASTGFNAAYDVTIATT